MTTDPHHHRLRLPRLLTDADVAFILNLSVQAMRDLRSRGGGPDVTRLGGRVRYHPEDVAAFLAARREAPA
ncbi:MAG: helix-turn-helix domain-containing protein, partial [Micrococcus sp.]|nr:helix-turn-helix domain-containing protein [Micrococcus sp.]